MAPGLLLVTFYVLLKQSPGPQTLILFLFDVSNQRWFFDAYSEISGGFLNITIDLITPRKTSTSYAAYLKDTIFGRALNNCLHILEVTGV